MTDDPLLPAPATSPAARLADAAREFFASSPMADGGYRSVALSRENVYRFSPRQVATRLLAPLLARYRVIVSDGDERRTVIRVRRDDPTTADPVTQVELREIVATVLKRLPDPPADAGYAVARAAADTRALAAAGVSWLGEVTAALVDALERLPALDPAPEVVRSPRPRTALSDEARTARRRQSRRDHMQRFRAEARENARDDMTTAAAWTSLWREQAPPGAHPATELHRTYAARVAEAGRDPVGRNTYYRIADEVCGPRKRRSSGPAYVVPQEVTPMTREERKALAGLIVDRLTDEWREHASAGLADLIADRVAESETATPAPAPATPAGTAHVVSLDARRRARRAA